MVTPIKSARSRWARVATVWCFDFEMAILLCRYSHTPAPRMSPCLPNQGVKKTLVHLRVAVIRSLN
jgi:hypothetical protein